MGRHWLSWSTEGPQQMQTWMNEWMNEWKSEWMNRSLKSCCNTLFIEINGTKGSWEWSCVQIPCKLELLCQSLFSRKKWKQLRDINEKLDTITDEVSYWDGDSYSLLEWWPTLKIWANPFLRTMHFCPYAQLCVFGVPVDMGGPKEVPRLAIFALISLIRTWIRTLKFRFKSWDQGSGKIYLFLHLQFSHL